MKNLLFFFVILLSYPSFSQSFVHHYPLLDSSNIYLFSRQSDGWVHYLDSAKIEENDYFFYFEPDKFKVIERNTDYNVTKAKLIKPIIHKEYLVDVKYFNKNQIKSYIEYNKNGQKVDTSAYFLFNEDGQILIGQLNHFEECATENPPNAYRIVQSFNNDKKLLSKEGFERRTIINTHGFPEKQWQLYSYQTVEHDSIHAQKISYFGNRYNINNTLKQIGKQIIQYTTSNKIDLEQWFRWDSQNQTWKDSFFIQYSYPDPTTTIKEITKYINGEWTNYHRKINIEIPTQSTKIIQSWDTIQHNWKNVYRNRYIDSEVLGNRNHYSDMWNRFYAQWNNGSSVTYQYAGDTIVYTSKAINSLKSRIYKYTVNENGDIKDINYYSINDEGIIEYTRKGFRLYDSFGILEHVEGVGFSNYDITSKTYYWGHTNISSTTEEENNKELYVFPNPATNHIIINSSENNVNNISIFDIKGNEVYKRDKNYRNTPIDINYLPKGTYFIKTKGYKTKQLIKL